ncbi:hypothetical protein [Bradyrhizobium sp. LB11.1]|jgi:hypothetical protein|uniref:hypothetical protein n=1 Tax=Bradyrhizobium sp. LB11.1 TaxID=3156326 RepID=UPI0033963DBE
MSAVTRQRFLVTGFDHDEWHIVVEAGGRAEAIRKAEAIYFADGLGKTDWFALCSSFIDWKAEPLMQGAQ